MLEESIQPVTEMTGIKITFFFFFCTEEGKKRKEFYFSCANVFHKLSLYGVPVDFSWKKIKNKQLFEVQGNSNSSENGNCNDSLRQDDSWACHCN